MSSDVAARPSGDRSAAPRRVSRATRERADQTASWPAILAWGAGLILTATGAGAATGNDLTPMAVRLVGTPLALLGIAIIAWGALVLARGRLLYPRWLLAGAVAGIVLAVVALALDPAGISIGAVAAASALLLCLAMLVAFRLRRPARSTRTGIAGIFLAAIVVAALTGPAITAASYARLTAANDGVPVVIPSHH